MTRSPDDWMCIGIVTSAHGVHGDVRIRPETDFPERFEEPESLTLLVPQPWPPLPAGTVAIPAPPAPARLPSRGGRQGGTKATSALPMRGRRGRGGKDAARAAGPAGAPGTPGSAGEAGAAGSEASVGAAGSEAAPPLPPPRRREARVFEVEESRAHKGGFLVKLAGVDDRDLADALRGVQVVVRRDQLMPLPENTWYVYELEGLQVYTEAGEHLGVLDEVLFTGGNDVYVVKGEREILLPAIRQVIREVDVAAGRMVVHLLEGL